MEIDANQKTKRESLAARFKKYFVASSGVSRKIEIDFQNLKFVFLAGVLVFVGFVLFLPSEPDVEFSAKMETTDRGAESAIENSGDSTREGGSGNLRGLWGAPPPDYQRGGGGGGMMNYNTSTLLNPSGGNAKTQIRAGLRLPLVIRDKFIVSDSPVPILAELILNTSTDSGLALPAGTSFYGEASFQRGGERAQVRFTRISLPSGEIRPISGIAVGKDGQPGLPGRVYSDGVRNTAGQVVTTFVGGLAAGSVETDALGRSRGGFENGLLTAIAVTAKDRARDYGEKMKAEREWIEVPDGFECDALLGESLNLGGDREQ